MSDLVELPVGVREGNEKLVKVSASACINSSSGKFSEDNLTQSALESIPTPLAGFNAASKRPSPDPIESTLTPSGIINL